MAMAELVDGDGWISDESSFYGDEPTKTKLESTAERRLQIPYNPFAHVLGKRSRLEHGFEAKKDRHASNTRQAHPQDAVEQSRQATVPSLPAKKRVRNVNGYEAADLLRSDLSDGHSATWQPNETVNDFLKRLPVADPVTSEVGPWLWVRNPEINREDHTNEDIDALIERGEQLLRAFDKQRSKLETENPGKTVSAITRYLRPHRDRIEEDLLEAAVSTGTTCGKWMLFPDSKDLPRYWRLVAEATAEGKLGPVSKVATYDPFSGKDDTLICVYTYDFTDLDDVRRVLEELIELDLCTRDGKPRYYKCDAYTYLGITSDNSYKLRASLFSSTEILGKNAKALANGPIERLKKRKTMAGGLRKSKFEAVSMN